jgi:chorismate mutase
VARMDIAGWRRKIDEMDRRLVELLSQRARAAREIGRLKRHTNMPIRERDRECVILSKVAKHNRGPIPDRELRAIYERIIAAMRKLQRDEMKGK